MQQNKSFIFKIIKDNEFIIPRFQRRYAWEESNCVTLFNTIQESCQTRVRCYIGNVFFEKVDSGKYLRVFDGQQRSFSLFLFYLALLYVGKQKNEESLIQEFVPLTQKRVADKFTIENNDRNDFAEFAQAFDAFLNKPEDKHPLLETSSTGRKTKKNPNRFIANFKEFVKLISDSTEDKDLVDVTLSGLRKALDEIQIIEVSVEEHDEHNNIQANKIFDSLNSTGKGLNLKDIINSRIAMLKDDNIKKKWRAFRKLLPGESNTTGIDPVDDFIRNYLTNIGYRFNLNTLVYFERELHEQLEESVRANPQREDLIKAYDKLLSKMTLLYYFTSVPKLEYGNEKEIKKCLLPEDRDRITTLQLEWLKMYLDGIAISRKTALEVKLYLRYIEDREFGLEKLLTCLHCLWCAVTRATLISYYRRVAQPKFKLEAIAVRQVTNADNIKDFVSEFRRRCEDYVPVVTEVDNSNESALVEYLVYHSTRTSSPNIVKSLGSTHLIKSNKYFSYFLYLLLFTGSEKQYGFTLTCASLLNTVKKDESKVNNLGGFTVQDLGNIVLINSKDDNDLSNKTVEERFKLIHEKARSGQYLPPLGTKITVEVLMERSKQILQRLFEVIDFDNSKHLSK